MGAPKLTEFVGEQGEHLTYSYGDGPNEGDLTEVTFTDGSKLNLTYNAQGELVGDEPVPAGQKSGTVATYTYYAAGNAPEPCTPYQKATVVSPSSEAETMTVYCANEFDEVEQKGELYRDTRPPVFEAELEVSAYLSPETHKTTLYWEEPDERRSRTGHQAQVSPATTSATASKKAHLAHGRKRRHPNSKSAA